MLFNATLLGLLSQFLRVGPQEYLFKINLLLDAFSEPKQHGPLLNPLLLHCVCHELRG